jgi:DNA-binding NtrC family response regulator
MIFNAESTMRILIVGVLNSPLTAAAKIATSQGATVMAVTNCKQAVAVLRSHGVVNLVMADVRIDIGDVVDALQAASAKAPIVACGTRNDVRTAVAAIHCGASEYISLLPDPDLIAAVLVAMSNGADDRIEGKEAVALAVAVAEQVRPSGALVRRKLADVERDLILDTLKHCLGNRTHAASILGISVRTLRNKLQDYAANGLAVPPPFGGELHGAA